MKTISLKLRSSIKPSLKQSILYKGTLLASIGTFAMVYSGIFIPASELERYGIFIVCLGIGFIALGLLPYRRISKLEKEPHEIYIVEEGSLNFLSKGKLLFTIPLDAILKIEHRDQKKDYGIALWLKESSEISDTNHITLKKISQDTRGCDLFLPYFTKRSYDLLLEFLTQEN
jgi:hypothetical protein